MGFSLCCYKIRFSSVFFSRLRWIYIHWFILNSLLLSSPNNSKKNASTLVYRLSTRSPCYAQCSVSFAFVFHGFCSFSHLFDRYIFNHSFILVWIQRASAKLSKNSTNFFFLLFQLVFSVQCSVIFMFCYLNWICHLFTWSGHDRHCNVIGCASCVFNFCFLYCCLFLVSLELMKKKLKETKSIYRSFYSLSVTMSLEPKVQFAIDRSVLFAASHTTHYKAHWAKVIRSLNISKKIMDSCYVHRVQCTTTRCNLYFLDFVLVF